MVVGLTPGSEVIAVTHVHAPSSNDEYSIRNYLPLIKGELLTITKAYSNTESYMRNRYDVEGLVQNVYVVPTDLYQHEDFFLTDFTSQMTEKVLSEKPRGSFIIRPNSKEISKIVISAKFERVIHYSFLKNGGGIEYNGVTYQSIPSFVNKCCNEDVLAGKLEHWIKLSDINVPQTSNTMGPAVNKQYLSFRIVGEYCIASLVRRFASI